MSNSDSFIEEVTEEVRRERLFGLMRRYGWIAIVAFLLVVGGAAFNEYRKARIEAQAQALGDAMLAALNQDDPAARADALAQIETDGDEGAAVLGFLTASAKTEVGDIDAAVAALNDVAGNADLPLIYRQVATFRSLLLQTDTLDAETRRAGFSELAVAGVPLRVLAQEQLAMIDIETGDTEAAIARLRPLLNDAESTAGLQRRALQAIVALGGTPDAPEDGATAASE